jgi:3-oxoacyl-[acyl-carrier protein] reductase
MAARDRPNMLTPIELIKATVDGMIARGFGRIVNITSSAVKAPIDVSGCRTARSSELTGGFVAGLARKVARHGVTINNLLPGSFDTDRLRGNMALRARPPASRSEIARSAESQRADASERRRSSARSARTCAAMQAGYIAGQKHSHRRRCATTGDVF